MPSALAAGGLLLCILVLCWEVRPVLSFREWNYSITTTDSTTTWQETWSQISDDDKYKAPRPRRGHTIVVAGDSLIMFGGRGNEADAVHIPKTYNVEKVQIHCVLFKAFTYCQSD